MCNHYQRKPNSSAYVQPFIHPDCCCRSYNRSWEFLRLFSLKVMSSYDGWLWHELVAGSFVEDSIRVFFSDERNSQHIQNTYMYILTLHFFINITIINAKISSNRRPVINDGAQNGPLDLVGRSWGSYQPVRTLQSRQLQDVSWCLLKNICLIEVPTLTDKEHNELLSKHFLLGCFRQNLNTYLSRLDPDLLNICPACKNSPHDNNHHFA